MRTAAAVVVTGLLAAAACGFGAASGATPRLRPPASLPADVPLPERAALRTALDLGAQGLNLVYEADGALADVAGPLRRRIAAAGWAPLTDVVLEQAVFASYRSGERTLALGVSRAGGRWLVSLSYAPRPYNPWEGDQG
jgi:hypothetical protein